MLRTRGRKIIQDVLSRKGRTLLVSAAIFIGVAGTIALFTMSESLVSQQEKDVQEERLAMAEVVVNAVSGAELDHAADLQTLQNAPGVTEVMGGIESQSVYFKRAETETAFEEGHIQAYAVVNEEGQLTSVFGDDAPIEPLRLEAGVYPRAGMKEVAVEKRLADKYGLKVGDPLYFRVFSALERWTVSALVFDAYSGQDKPQEAIFARVEDATYLVGLSGFTHFWFRFTDFPTAEAQIDSIVNELTATMPYIPTATITEDPKNNTLLQGARITGSLMSSLAIIALMVSGFLVINVISAIVIEQKRQIGVMKSLGASRMDTMLIYSGVALVYGILGVIPGVLVGIPAGNMAAKGIAPEMNILLHGFQWSAFSIGLGILLGLLVPVVASLLPVFNGTRVKILDAMTDLGIDTHYGGGILAAFIQWLPLPTTIKQGFSNVVMKKTRILFTVMTLAVAVGAFMGIYSGFDQLKTGLSRFEESYQAQIVLLPLETRPASEIQAVIQNHFAGRIRAVEAGVQMAVEFKGFQAEAVAGSTGEIYAYGYDTRSPNPAFTFTLEQGQPITPATEAAGIIISSKLADSMGKTVGDKVVMTVPGRSATFEIVGIADYPFDQVWMHGATLAALSGYSPEQPPAYYLITEQKNPSAEAVDDLMKELNSAFAEAGIPTTSTNLVQVVGDVTQTYTSFQMIFQVVALLIALVGALGLLITLSMSVYERQKEIGVMRSIGASATTVASQFVTEGMLVGLFAWLVGLPLMIGIEIMLIEVTGMKGVLRTEITPAPLLIGLVGVALLTFVASLLPALSAARKTVSDILRYA